MSGVQSEFIGYVSHPSLGEGQVRGVIRFVQWRLRFENESVTHEIPLTRVTIDIESDDEERVCFYDPNDPEWQIWTPDVDILAHRTLLQQPHTRNQIRQLQAAPDLKRRLKLIGGFIAGFVVLCLLGSLALGVMVRILVHRVPQEWEAKLGADIMKDIRKQAHFLDDTNLLAQLEWDVAPLTNALPPGTPPCKFYILDDPLPNAFALPGGYVVVHRGLMRLADTPEEVAGVVAHELAHVTEKHGLRILVSSAGPFFVVKTFFGGGEGMLGALGAGSQLLVRQSFSQEFETEADDTGWDYLVKARIDPRGLAGMLRKLEEEYGNMNVIRPELGPFSSHPATEKRIARLNAKWNNLKKKPELVPYGEPPAQH